jgi:hypothetical protein
MNLRIAPLAALGLAALAGINLWLLTIILTGAADEEPVSAASPVWDAKWSGHGKADVAAKPISAYAQILAQPVFFKTREPYVAPPSGPAQAPVPVVAKPPPPPVVDPGFTVAGIIIGQGVRKAYIHTKRDEQGSWVSEGESLTGWRVKAIGPGGVKLEQQDRTIELELYPAKSDDHAPPPAASPRSMAGAPSQNMAGPPSFLTGPPSALK